MDKTALRKQIREKKRAMTAEQIESASRDLGEQFAASPLYQAADTIYGYLPYNQEVRTVPMLQRALREGKRVAVPKVYGDEMRFIYLDDLSAVEKGYAGIPEPIADEPVAEDKAAAFTISFWQRSRDTLLWRCAMISRCFPIWIRKNLTCPWTVCCGLI